MNVTWLNLELGAPLQHLNHLSTLLWVSDEPSVRSAFVLASNQNSIHQNRLTDCGLSLI